jgi:uncharacterized protein with HEPN domain
VRRDDQRLRDILDAIGRIERAATRGREAFDTDELVQVWMIHHIGVIGEAARALTASLREQHSEVPWAAIVGMRHILVHDYFGIDLEEIWSVVKRDLPVLKGQIEAILREEDSA